MRTFTNAILANKKNKNNIVKKIVTIIGDIFCSNENIMKMINEKINSISTLFLVAV